MHDGEKAYVARPGLRLWSADSTGKVWLACHVIMCILANGAVPMATVLGVFFICGLM